MKNYNQFKMENIHTDNLLLEIKNKLEGNGFHVVIINDISQIKKLINETIPEDTVVALDGSGLITEINIPEFLRENWNVIVDPYNKNTPRTIKSYLQEKLKSAEYYITAPDAITMDGKVVFNEKNSFLASAKHVKPGNIYAIAGSDSIVKNIEAARNKLSKKEMTVLEVSPFGLQRRAIDNYGQMEEYQELMNSQNQKQNTFTIVLLAEEHVY